MTKSSSRSRKKLWLIASGTSAAILLLTYGFGAFSSDGQSGQWHAWPVVPFLPMILGVFLYGVTRIDGAIKLYQIEETACDQVATVLRNNTSPQEVQNKLFGISQTNTAIGRRI